MKGIAFTAAAALVAGVALASGTCDQAYRCEYTYTNLETNTQYKYDFAPLCSANGGNDFVSNDNQGHTYYAKICGQAAQNCLPANWKNTYEFGVAVQNWGSQPTCDHAAPACQQKNPDGSSSPKCCTKDCQVLGTGNPTWSLNDPNDPVKGGVIAAYKGAAASDDDPFWCNFNPATGAQYEREVHFIFTCDPSVDSVNIVKAVQNGTNDCRYKIYFATSAACADSSSDGGWIFIIVLVSVATLYLAIGSGLGYMQTKSWELPNKQFWSEFADLVKAGIAFTMSGFKKGGSGSYSDIDSSGGGSATYQSSSYQSGSGAGEGDKSGAYTDL